MTEPSMTHSSRYKGDDFLIATFFHPPLLKHVSFNGLCMLSFKSIVNLKKKWYSTDPYYYQAGILNVFIFLLILSRRLSMFS